MTDNDAKALRDPIALAMLAAWLNVQVDQIPENNRAHLNPSTMAAWKRVAEAALSALPALEPTAEGFTALEAWHELVNYDDRTSPEEYPDMALITFEELRMFMSRANFTGCTCGEIAGEDPGCIVHSSTPPATLDRGLH